MEIRAESKYDYDTLQKFYKFNISKRKSKVLYKIVKISVLFFLSAWAVSNTYTFIAFGTKQTETIPFFIFSYVLLLLFIFIYFIFPAILPKIALRKNKMTDVLNTYVFAEGKMTVSTAGNGANGSSELDYTALSEAYETGDSFYIYFGLNAFLVSKKNLDENTVNELRNLLKSKLPPEKYKIRK